MIINLLIFTALVWGIVGFVDECIKIHNQVAPGRKWLGIFDVF
jgi:hypothetical protein